MNDLFIGSRTSPDFRIRDGKLMKLSAVMASDVIGSELAYDTMSASVYDEAYLRLRFVPKNSTGLITADGLVFTVGVSDKHLDKLPYGTPIWWLNDQLLTTKMYVKSVKRTGKATFDVQAVSAVGILDGLQFNGGIYNGTDFQTLASDIIGGYFPFTIENDLASVPVFGWLGISTRRYALHQLLFATGAQIVKDSNGDIVFRFPQSADIVNVPKSRIYIDGDVDSSAPASDVEVTEHAFFATAGDETVTLFDNTDGSGAVSNQFIAFDAPCHNLSGGGLTISEQGANFAVVSGAGTLTGKKYTHTQKVVTASKQATTRKTVTVTDATLVSLANSRAVADRVLSYYSASRRVKSAIVLDGEKAGDLLQFTNAFDEPDAGFIASMTLNASSFIKADCEIVSGYVPSAGGNNFSSVETVTASRTWTVPAGKTRVRVVLIQGGAGGQGGFDGERGKGEISDVQLDDHLMYGGTDYYRLFYPNGHQTRSQGGAAGAAGAAGKVHVVDLAVTPGQTISIAAGSGGTGGAGNGGAGAAGGHSTAVVGGTTYTSASGAIQPYGYFDLFGGIVYALAGDSGIAGAAGGLAGGTAEGATYGYEDAGEAGSALQSWHGGARGARYRGNEYYEVMSGGGGGGGAAFGAHGNPGGAGHKGTYSVYPYGGYGGEGASALPPQAPTAYGNGGNGGNGGGGGGNRGGASVLDESGYSIYADLTPYGEQTSRGGAGSRGSDGAPGAVLIYY